jgi:DNA-binding transcriptional MerR regulator
LKKRSEKYLRSCDLARAAGISTQQIRNYEAWGFIPRAERGAQGYRQYNQQHLRALLVVRSAIQNIGWQSAFAIMQAIHNNEISQATALINARHAAIHQRRLEIEAMLKIFRHTASTLAPDNEVLPHKRRHSHIHEAARAAGVRVSAVRFWEERGLLQPTRDKENRYRLYDAEQVRRLQIVALLRKTGYDFAAIESVLNQIANGTPEQAIQAAEQRLKDLAEESRRCVETTALFWDYLQSYSPIPNNFPSASS